MEKLVLIDGNSLINRAFYATPILSTKKGVYTNAVFGFINMFLKMLSDIKPTYCAVAFDVHAPTFRHKMYDQYKGTRKPMPEELRPQIALLKEILSVMNITMIEKAGIEADDIIGTISKHTKIQTYIFTGDRDSFQLVDDETTVCYTKRGVSDIELYNAQNFYEKTSLLPYQIIELKALMGDASDNIPGVSGIGEKGALSMLNEYQTVDNIYQHIDDFKGSKKEKLINGKEMAYLSKTLATINTDCDFDFDVEKMRVSFPFPIELRKKFIELELKILYNRLDLFEKQTEDNESSSPEIVSSNGQVLDLKKVNVENLDDIKTLTLDSVTISVTDKAVDLFSVDTEYILPIRQTLLDDGFNMSEILQAITGIVDNAKSILLYDKKEFRHLLRQVDYYKPFVADDLSIMKYLADFSERKESLTDVILAYSMDENTPAYAIYNIFNQLKNKLHEENMDDLYSKMELPLCDVLYDMEVSGFKVDADALYELGKKYREKLNAIEGEILSLSGEQNINLNSPKQLGELIFDKMGLGKGKKTKFGYSTSAEVLEAIEDKHPIIPLILAYRKLQKLLSTYIDGFKPLIDKNTGLIHTSFNQTITSTGRLSSKEPNLQNIPVRNEEGKDLRKFFIPKSQDRILISADYSQIELRLLAVFSKCQALIDAFNSGKDVHSQTASKVFNVPLKEVTPAMRGKAKAVNFGIIYGISEYGLSKNINTTPAMAKQYINAYFEEFPEVKQFMKDSVEFARANGYAITDFKRRRYIREINSSNYNVRQFSERVAMNMPLQGTGADVIKMAMIGVSKRLKAENLRSELILQIHDELIVDAFTDEQDKIKQILKEEMENAVHYSVNLAVSVGQGRTWFDAK